MKIANLYLKFTAISLIVIALVVSFSFWLWQRQPKPDENQKSISTVNQEGTREKQEQKAILTISPKDGTVLNNNEVKFQVETSPNEYVVISSNFTQSIGKANSSGKFELDLKLEDGLNLINIVTVNENSEETQSRSISIYIQESTSSTKVFSGPVKSILDDLITITTNNGEQTMRWKKSTDLILPTSQNNKEDTDIRVGDYLITLGTIENEKDFNAISIEVIRQNKPQNLKKFIAGITLTGVKNNLFSVRNQKDSSIAELTVDKNSVISQNGQEVDIEKVLKDKRAIIIYHSEDDKNIVDLIYLID